MYTANVYNVMIVSPSDVTNERELIRQILYDWNIIHSANRGIMLQPSGWEINSYPLMGEHPQTIINNQLLDQADILIGVFWTKIGTKTEHYESGTVEEITKHIKSGKPALLYFSNVPVRLDSVDDEQYKKLKEYQRSINQEGYYFEYDKIDDFFPLVNKHLQLLINDKKNKIVGTNQENITNDDVLLENNSYNTNNSILSNLTETAKFLLKEASHDSTGTFMKLNVMGGVHIQTNGKAWLFKRNNPKELAELEEAIELLELYNLVTTRSIKREVFNLTADGFRLAESYEIQNDA